MTLGPVVFTRRGSRTVGLAVGALALVILLLAAMLFLAPPPGNDSPGSTAVGFGVVGLLLGMACWRSLGGGQWFCANGFRQRGLFTSLTYGYSELTEVTHEDLVVNYRGHHHTVIVRFNAKGKPHKLLLTGKVGPDLSEKRDPDADAIITLLRADRG